MKKILVLLFILCSNVIYSQNTVEYKNKDSIYILFDENEKFENLNLKKEVNQFDEIYYYIFPDSKTIILQVNLIKSSSNPSVIKRKRSFFKKRFLNVISINEIQALGFNNFISLIFSKNLTVFIIKKEDFNKRKITIKQAKILNINPLEM